MTSVQIQVLFLLELLRTREQTDELLGLPIVNGQKLEVGPVALSCSGTKSQETLGVQISGYKQQRCKNIRERIMHNIVPQLVRSTRGGRRLNIREVLYQLLSGS